jgi:hypothetical protein
MIYEPEDNWRNDPGLTSKNMYKKKYALFPTKCEDGTVVWLKNYYVKYRYWGFRRAITAADIADYRDDLHEDKCENITEAEYIVRRLTEGI